jgi:hypothetical protein
MRKMLVCMFVTCALLSGLTGCQVHPVITQTFQGADGNRVVTPFLYQGDTLQWIQAQQAAGATPKFLIIKFDGDDPCGLGGQFVVPYDKPFQCKITSPNGIYYYSTSLVPPPPPPPNPHPPQAPPGGGTGCKWCPTKPPQQCPSGCPQIILLPIPGIQVDSVPAPSSPFVVLCDHGQPKVKVGGGVLGADISVRPGQEVSWYPQGQSGLTISPAKGMCQAGDNPLVQGQICKVVGSNVPYTYKVTLTSCSTTNQGTGTLAVKPQTP